MYARRTNTQRQTRYLKSSGLNIQLDKIPWVGTCNKHFSPTWLDMMVFHGKSGIFGSASEIAKRHFKINMFCNPSCYTIYLWRETIQKSVLCTTCMHAFLYDYSNKLRKSISWWFYAKLMSIFGYLRQKPCTHTKPLIIVDHFKIISKRAAL